MDLSSVKLLIKQVLV